MCKMRCKPRWNQKIKKCRIEIEPCNLGCLGYELSMQLSYSSTYQPYQRINVLNAVLTIVVLWTHPNLKYQSIITIRDLHRIQFNVVEDRTSDANSYQIKYENLRVITQIVHSKHTTPTKIHSRLALQIRNVSGK